MTVVFTIPPRGLCSLLEWRDSIKIEVCRSVGLAILIFTTRHRECDSFFGPKEISMRFVIVLLALAFLTCSTSAVSQGPSKAATPGQGPAPEGPAPLAESPMEYLVRSAASDFHAHRPPVVERFRHVRFGHVMTPAGAKQYQLCGEFLPQQRGGKAEWTPFATIKTFGYEQYLGDLAASWCQRPRFVRDGDEDLSSTLQSRLDSMQ